MADSPPKGKGPDLYPVAAGWSDERPRSTLQVLDRALGMLSLFNDTRSAWTLTEMSGDMGVALPTTRRIAEALRQHGYLVRDTSTKRYRLGVSAVELGVRAQRSFAGGRAMSAALERLAGVTGDTAFYVVPSDNERWGVCVAQVEGEFQLRLSMAVGRRHPMHTGAVQKAMLAFLGEHARQAARAAVRREGGQAAVEALDRQLAEIRARGWASTKEEAVPGTWGVAVPLGDADGVAVGALAVAGAIVRYSEDEERTRVKLCVETARDLADALGLFAPPATPGARAARRIA